MCLPMAVVWIMISNLEDESSSGHNFLSIAHIWMKFMLLESSLKVENDGGIGNKF